jgi:cytoplasmic iron level regulating protein YaaA (DUF328/UPF0246 family)
MAAKTPVVLIPPSEGKAEGGTGPPWSAGTMVFPELDHLRARVLPAVGADVAAAPTMAAIDRYTGVLAQHLDYRSLSARHRRRVDAQVLIVWGAVAPRDLIPSYRLKMSASLPGLGRMSRLWRDPLSEALTRRVAGRTVWNLLPNEHAAAWVPRPPGTSGAPARIISVSFLDEVERSHGRELIVVSHWNKALKGAVVRAVVADQLRAPDDLVDFVHPAGYRYDHTLTDLAVDGDPCRARVVLAKRLA